jgi:hypothetical protein
MPLRLALLAALLVLSRAALSQGADAAMQNLLAGLTRGTQVMLYTPLANGMVEVTRFTPPVALGRPEAEAAVAIARQHLRMLDIEVPTADQLARALVGGTIETRDGPQRLPGVLPLTGEPPIVTTDIVVAGAPVLPPSFPQPASAATGGSAAPAYPGR